MTDDRFTKYIGRGITGLTNVGNTCYMNSCLQCLSHTYELNRFLDDTSYKEKLTNTPDSIILVEWDSLRTMMWSQNCTISPYGFVKALHKVATAKNKQLFAGYEQNDLQEFLMFLLESFHSSISRPVNMKMRGKVKNKTDLMAVECYKMMSNMYKKDYSEMISMFYGIQVSSITSIDDSETLTMRAEPFSVLSLSIQPTDTGDITIYSCMDEYCKKDRLEKDNAWFNEKTNRSQDVDKCVVFWNFPDILIVHLKRWDYTGNKDRRFVNIPLDDIDLSRYVKGYNKETYLYGLYGVCNHHGGAGGGHYTSNIKTANGEWYRFDDDNVDKITTDNVVSINAYCLFFRKKNNK